MKLFHTVSQSSCCACSVLAQEQPRQRRAPVRPGQARGWSPPKCSGRCGDLRLLAPKAAEVLVQEIAGGRGLAMTRDGSGLWSATTAALQPSYGVHLLSGWRQDARSEQLTTRARVSLHEQLLVPAIPRRVPARQVPQAA